MQEDFHYYATYCAAYIAGFSHEESQAICYSANFVDLCSRTLLRKIGAPGIAATTQLQLELMEARTDTVGLQDITRIWASFHFLPYDLYAEVKHGFKLYKSKYRLICNSNGQLVSDTVNLAKGTSLQGIGLAMHVLADTWAHKYFVGTPSFVINSTNYYFYELIPDGDSYTEKLIEFKHSPSGGDDPEKGIYSSSLPQWSETSIMNLGHGRAGHLPDYSYIRYKYLPAWGQYQEFIKDNPSDYYHAFCQMVYALKYLHGDNESFELNRYDEENISKWKDEINSLLTKRQVDACADWKAFAQKLSGCQVDDFDIDRYQQEYKDAPKDLKDQTFLGRFILAALAQKSMVTNKIFKSGNKLAGISIDYNEKGLKGMKAFYKLSKKDENGGAK